MRTRRVLWFSLIAYGVTWFLVLPLVLQNAGRMPFQIPGLWHGAGALGPLVAAFFMRRGSDPQAGLGDLYRRQGPAGVSAWLQWVMVMTPLILAGLTLAGVAAFWGPLDFSGLAEALASPAWVASTAVGSVLYGLGEEPGWRGWLLPHLQENRGAVRATLILSLIWAGWHAPFFFYRFPFEGAITIVGFFIGMLAGAFWLTFLFNSTGGSVWAVVFWHMIWNVVSISALQMSEPVVVILNALMMVLGFGAVVLWGRQDLTLWPGSRTESSPNRAAAPDGGS